MKILALIILSIGSLAFSAELNLSTGESAWIQANVNTLVRCNAGTDNNLECTQAVKKAESSYTACTKSGYTYQYCFDKNYSKKVNNCNEWSNSCNVNCQNSGYSSQYCYDKCF